jgi:hypothetical protein
MDNMKILQALYAEGKNPKSYKIKPVYKYRLDLLEAKAEIDQNFIEWLSVYGLIRSTNGTFKNTRKSFEELYPGKYVKALQIILTLNKELNQYNFRLNLPEGKEFIRRKKRSKVDEILD